MHCHACKKTYLHKGHFMIHFKAAHKDKRNFRKPAWMEDLTFQQATRQYIKFNHFIHCEGCKDKFTSYKNQEDGKLIPELLFHIHRVEQCRPFKELCEKRVARKAPVIKRAKLDSELPSWMPVNLLVESTLGNFPEIVYCKGCQRRFKARIDPNSGFVPELDYYIHCIERCLAFRKLGLSRGCKDCDLKFLTAGELWHHFYNKHLI